MPSRACRFASPAKLADFDDELNRGGALAEVPLIAAVTMAIQDGQLIDKPKPIMQLVQRPVKFCFFDDLERAPDLRRGCWRGMMGITILGWEESGVRST